MITKHPSEHRGRTHLSWLDGLHSFSFGNYYDERYMGVANLRVLNHDVIAPGGGFAPHPHRNMEIVTIVLRGGIKHADNTGSQQVLTPTDVQAMSAGSGIAHSEYNASRNEEAEMLQIWLYPEARGLQPGYADFRIHPDDRDNQWATVASGRSEGGLTIHTDATIRRGSFSAGVSARHILQGRPGYLYVVEGEARVGDQTLGAGDAAIITNEEDLNILVREDADLVLFDLAA
jgi:redox-sensitive bicupin YhaK (pirin superfamily)